MKKIAKVSEIDVSAVADYIRLTEVSQDDMNTIETLIEVAKAFICKHTGLNKSDLDKHEDFIIVVLILCQDMYDNRSLIVDNTNMNKVVTTILDLHSNNLLPSVGDEDD